MGVVVISKSPSVVVKPSEEAVTATGDINLSSYDKYCVNTPATAFFVFEHQLQEPVDTIKRALSQALVHYYPVAGRLAAGATAGEGVIKCTGEGVSFVAASADCAVKDVQDWSDPSIRDELAVFYPAADGMCRYSDPLLLMQLTVFSGGGFVLGVTFNHALADGVGMCQFLQAVGELSRGLPSPSVAPLRQEDSIACGPPPFFASFVRFLGGIKPSQMVVLDIAVKSSLINRIKDRYASVNSGRPCTVFEAVAAVLWRCRTRATMSESDPDALIMLVVVTNARKYAGAKQGYYGNCVLADLVSATAGAVANGELMDVVKMIRGAKGRLPDKSAMDEVAQVGDSYNILSVNSWRNAVGATIDFGAGRPARVMGHSPGTSVLPKCTAGTPCGDQYNMLSVCVKEDHAAAFLQELADAHHLLHIRSPL